MLFLTGGVSAFLTFVVLAVADGLVGLRGSERRAELSVPVRSPAPNEIFLENLSLIKNRFFSPIALMYDSVCVCVCVCVYVCVCVCVCVCMCM